MATANLTLPDGSKVTLEGTAEEVSLLLTRFASVPQNLSSKKGRPKTVSKSQGQRSGGRKSPQQLIAELAAADFFKSKRTISQIQQKLQETGHIYAQNSLSTPLLRLTRAGVLRRLREKGGWAYVS